jgi:hypothetical protein
MPVLSTWNNSAPIGRISMKRYYREQALKSAYTIQGWLKQDKNILLNT